MSIQAKKHQILEILVENLRSVQPQVVPSEIIADKLEMSVKETCSLLKIMHEMGVVVSDLEGQNSLITREGIRRVN